MKKWTAVLLAALLALACLGVCADGGSELGAATLVAKDRLGIGDDYDEFYSDSYEDYAGKVYWSLSWSGAQKSVYVTCDRAGNVYEYSRYDGEDYEVWSNDFAPRLVEETEDQYRPAAEAFLDANIGNGFGWRIESAWPGKVNYRVTDFTFSGLLTFEGYDTGVSLSVTVRVRDSVVTGFWRSDVYKVYTDFTAPQKPVDAGLARSALEEGLRMDLRYVPGEGDEAELRYLPRRDDSGLVDAATGRPFDPEVGEDGPSPYAEETMDDAGRSMKAADSASGVILTEAELSGIAAAEGLLSGEELDARARAIAEFGLNDSYVLTRSSTYRSGDDVLCELRYQANVDRDTLRSVFGLSEDSLDSLSDRDDMRIEKAVCLNAADGAIITLHTFYPFYGGIYTYRDRGEDEMRVAAEAFLTSHFPERMEHAALSDVSPCDEEEYWYDPGWIFTFDRAENGIPYEYNYLVVAVNVDTGLVDDYNSCWEDDLTFESPEGIISADEARAIWLEQLETGLRFVDTIDSSVDYALTYKGVLCYELRAGDGVESVTARDGSLHRKGKEGEGFAYADLEGCDARGAIETLAAHGIGFAGGAFRPDEPIALRDWLVLLFQSGDYSWAVNSADAELITLARDAGIPLPGEDLNAAVTRAQAARMLIGMSGYGKAAALRDAYVCGFSDDDLLADEEYGFLAIARAMGVARADTDGAFRPLDAATRADAAEMLLAFLTRAI